MSFLQENYKIVDIIVLWFASIWINSPIENVRPEKILNFHQTSPKKVFTCPTEIFTCPADILTSPIQKCFH